MSLPFLYPPFFLHDHIQPLPSLKILLDIFEPYQKPPETELLYAFSFPVFTFIDDSFLMIIKLEDRLGNARQPVCLFANLQLTNTLVRVERDYKIRQYFTVFYPLPLNFLFLKVNVYPWHFFGMKRQYADDINLNCLDLQIPFFSELALGPGCINRPKQTKHFKFHQIDFKILKIEEKIETTKM